MTEIIPTHGNQFPRVRTAKLGLRNRDLGNGNEHKAKQIPFDTTWFWQGIKRSVWLVLDSLTIKYLPFFFLLEKMWQELPGLYALSKLWGPSFTVVLVRQCVGVTGGFNCVLGPDSASIVFLLLGWTRMAGLSSCCKGSVQHFVQSHRESQEYEQTPSDLLTAPLRQNQILLYCTFVWWYFTSYLKQRCEMDSSL